MQAVLFAVCGLVLVVSLLWLLLPRPVVEIPGADAEDREMYSLVCDPDALDEILNDVPHNFLTIRQIDLVIQALAKRGHVIIGPSPADVQQAVALLEGRNIP